MGDHLAPAAEQDTRRRASGRPARAERDLLRAAYWLTLAGLAGALRPLHDGLQPLQPLGQSGRVAAHLRGAGGSLAAVPPSDRQLDCTRPPACGRRKKGGPDHAIGRSRGGLSTKINAVVDGAGLPVALSIAPGQASDKAAVPDLVERIPPGRDLIADRGYDAVAILGLVAARGGRAHIPTQRDRKVQRSVPLELYRERNLVERFFNKMKHFRRIATRFDKLARNYLAALHLAAARLWARTYESKT